MVSIIIPSRNEIFLEKTVKGLLDNCTGEFEILVVLDGYNPPERNSDSRVKYILHEDSVGMRAGINSAVKIAKGEFLMKIDAHCVVDKGIDEKLAADCGDNTVMIPRRYKLDDENWRANMNETPIDYEHFIYPLKYDPVSLHGFRWKSRAEERKDILIDDTLTFQGSCWFMKKSHFEKHKFLKVKEFHGLLYGEPEELGLTTWLSGGRVVTNKKTWYAHLFKGKKYGRGYFIDRNQGRDCYRYSYNYWANENKEGFIKVIEKFWPIPGWPADWKERLWN
ncbi:MAG: glycosyltransferase family 2 protein [Parcubacteria group bacterium]|nr:glycosyltransferase family 2 protein [Parcubacteria group bacterium]